MTAPNPEMTDWEEILDANRRAQDAARPEVVAARRTDGRLTARERVLALLDPGSFAEFGLQAESNPGEDGSVPGDGVVCGTGRIGGSPVTVAAYDPTVFGGAQTRVNQAKVERMIFLANEHAWPFVAVLEGGGERAREGSSGGSWASGRVGLIDGLSELSGLAPIVAVVAGPCHGAQEAIASLADCVVAVKGAALGTPGSKRAVETLERAGEVDLVVDSEPAAFETVRRYLGYFAADLDSGEPASATATIGSVIPANRRRAYDMRKVIAALADDGSALELRPNWGTSLLTVLARMGGRTVGIFGNQPISRWAGAIDIEAADKMSRFIELCSAYDLPLVSLIDSPGFAIGPDAERQGIARHHIRTLNAIHYRTVPLYCVQLRKAYGLGPIVMRGSGGRKPPELRLAWPTVETGGMSLEGAAYLVRRKEILAAKTPEEALAIRDEYAEQIRRMNSGIRAGQNFSFDEVIDPAETRDRIIGMLRLSERPARSAKRFYLDTV